MPTWKKRLLQMWTKRSGSTLVRIGRLDGPAVVRRTVTIPSEYRSLHKYLDDRYAGTVVLTFSEIEDLLGFTLPAPARVQQEWWADPDADSTRSAQSRSWTEASRTAKPNFLAQTVAFERV